ncbi:FkbM family methyltransferase [Pseudomonas sp. AOB-7]|uniref:FkbM family methyltransferase n=1 Tax=Pseudomonas sp. AOB-7 TaxID=2482750 RepID=UPI000EFBFD8C|nr:FkbM family methyltransferase [Pseudomonas sp. AOB-7]RMH82306.1 FkbM family methyltransferase [Pseudomonas sp. AOB-7]
MVFISYAQNFEDVTLWRALKLFGPGFYIDIGANHPTRDSVTRSLYERGWRGINIEPVLHYYESLCNERPEDINLCMAVGDEESDLIFFESPETGLSTLSLEMAERQKAEGIPFVQRTVKTRTLASICDEHARRESPIHFLKIDVEGFEEQVLRGMDFQKWRPWIILIESSYDSDPHWKSLILDAGYQFAFCDGINRYYVAKEKLELLVPLSLPPNILDDFQLCDGHLLSHPVSDVQLLKDNLCSATRRADTAEAQLYAIYNSRLWVFVRFVTAVRRMFSSK